jgi:hypothetical protein
MAIYDGAGGCFFFLFSSFSSLSSLCVACLLFFRFFFVCLPPLLLFLVFVFLFSALLALFACLLSPLSFLLSYFLRTGCCDNNKGKSTRTENRTEKIVDNSGSVWLTGVNLASLKMGLNVAFLFTGPFQGVVNVPAGRSVGLRVYGRTPAGILELESRYSPP